MGFPKIRGTILGVPKYIGVPLFWETICALWRRTLFLENIIPGPQKWVQ